MFLALTAGQKLGLALVAGLFIAFAVASAFLLPRRNPDFPGERLRLFVAVTGVLFVAMITAVVVLAREEPEEAHPEAAAETVGEPAGTEPAVGGDAEAGAQVFAGEGCGGCHTLAAAGASGTLAPNLDQTQPSFELAVDRVTNGQGQMPAFGDKLSPEQIRDVAAYVVESTRGG